jgi:hypothetical protein
MADEEDSYGRHFGKLDIDRIGINLNKMFIA